MAREILIVFTNPEDDMEDEYNEWYDNVHLPEVLNRGTMVSAQRYLLSDVQKNEEPPFKYAAIYDLGEGGAASDIEAGRTGSPPTPTSTLDRSKRFSFYFVERGPKAWAPGQQPQD